MCGILKTTYKNEFGVEYIKLIIIYNKLVFEPSYFGFNNGSDKSYICDDVVFIIDSRENIEFGLLGRYYFDAGQVNAYSYLANGEVLYDKMGKYGQLQKEVKKDAAPRRTRSSKPFISVPRVS